VTSTNATNWVTRASGTTNPLAKANYANGIFVVTGQGGVILTSADGTSWTSRTSGTTNNLSGGMAFGNGLFVVTGDNVPNPAPPILTSLDGVTWANQTAAANHELSAITYGNGMFVAVGSQGGVQTSPDGTNWTARSSGDSGHQFYGVAYGNGTFVAVGDNGTILQSGDTRLRLVQPAVSVGSFAFTITNGVGQRSRIQASTNLTAWVDILTNNTTPASLPLQDTNAGSFPRRSYRAVVP
jgi:photosystem II stability/assembly factor-like uncharacterized protein